MLISRTSGKQMWNAVPSGYVCHVSWKKEMKQKNTLTRILTSSYLSKGNFQVLPYFDDFWVVLVDHKYIVDNQEEMIWPCTKTKLMNNRLNCGTGLQSHQYQIYEKFKCERTEVALTCVVFYLITWNFMLSIHVSRDFVLKIRSRKQDEQM